MATLNEEQIKGLNAASSRVTSGLANEADKTNLDYATKNLGYKPPTITPIDPAPAASPNAGLADAVQNSGKAPTQAEWTASGQPGVAPFSKPATSAATGSATETDWMSEWMKSAFGQGDQAATDQVQAPTFDVEKARLEQAKTSRIQALDTQYATNLANLQKKNKDLGSSLKARLMKLGVSPSDSAWSNAEAGQAQRDAEAEAGLRAEYMSNKAAIESDLDAKITNIAMNEATMNFNATVKNIENKLQTQAQGINLYQIFASRDQSEKDREQRAYSALMDYEAKMLTLDQNQQEAIAKNLIDNAQKGLYNISDKATLEMLANLEKQSPYLTGLTNIASAGLSDRLDQKAENAAQLSLIKAQTAAANRSNQKSGNDDDGKEAENFYKDVDAMADDLAAGKRDWGQAYNFLVGKYGTDIGAEIDTLLNKDYWSQTGAYEERQKNRQNTNQPTFVINTGA